MRDRDRARASCSRTRWCAAIRTRSTTASIARGLETRGRADASRGATTSRRSASRTSPRSRVNDPAYYTAIAGCSTTEKPAALRSYLTADRAARVAADDLGKAWVDEAFTMRKELDRREGAAAALAPLRRAASTTISASCSASRYVAARFAGDAKARAVDLTRAVLGAMRVELDALPWMDEPTRAAAKQKLDKMAYLVGFPDTWRALRLRGQARPTSPATSAPRRAGSSRASSRRSASRSTASTGGMTPPTVNAYYDPTLNEIALPAGQLQPPFFGATLPPRGQLRLDRRRHDRPRDDARLRRRGQPVRRRRQPARLVEQVDQGQVRRRDQVRGRPVRALRGRPEGEARRQAHRRREHRRQRRRQARVPGLPGVEGAAGRAAAARRSTASPTTSSTSSPTASRGATRRRPSASRRWRTRTRTRRRGGASTA